MNVRTSYLCALACAILPCHGFADAMTDKDKQKAEQFLSFGIPNGLDMTLSKEDTKGSAGVTYVLPDNLLGLALTGKLKDNTGEFVGLDGIDANTKVTGTWSHFFASLGGVSEQPFTFDQKGRDEANHALGYCQQLNITIKNIGDIPKDSCENEQTLISMLETLTFSPDDAKKVSGLASQIEEKCKDYEKRGWAEEFKIADYCKRITKMREVLSTDTDDTPALTDFGVFSASVSYFQSQFKWLNIDTLTELDKRTTSKTKDGFDATVSYAKIYANPLFKWEVGTTYQKGYSNSSTNIERELCFDFNTDAYITECVNGFLQPPLETETISPFIKLTHQLDETKIIKSIGFSVKYTFEDKKNQLGEDKGLNRWTIDVPVHVIDLMDKKLSAGLKLSWVSEVKEKEDPIKFVLFVSAPLTIFSK